MSLRTRVGLIGFGAVAQNAYAPALKNLGVRVEGVAEPNEERRAAAFTAFPGARIYGDMRDLLRGSLAFDILIVATPPAHHADAVLAGLKSRLHVLCEKPLTLDGGALAAMRAAAVAADRAVYCVNNWAYSPQMIELRRVARDPRFGKTLEARIEVQRTQPSNSAVRGDWRRDPALAGGGILVDHGWHNLYLLRELLGPGLRLESANLSPAPGVEDEAEIVMADGAVKGVLKLSWRAEKRANFISVRGAGGSAQIDDDVLVCEIGGEKRTRQFEHALSAGSAHPEWLEAMWPAFALETGGEKRGRSLDEAQFCLDAIRSAYAAGKMAHV